MLVIVESPSKCKIIEVFLGPEYKCIATNGHFRTITDLKSIDFEKKKVKYSIIEKHRKNLQKMKKEISKATTIFLATDNDREGEAIAWHICDLFKLSLDTPRIVFNEITKQCIVDSIQRPRSINMNIVKMQQNRQILDIIIGYKLSPLLWKHISRNAEKSLSAGRCQTPALRIIYEHYINVKPLEKDNYIVKGYFTANNILFKATIKEEFIDTFISSTEKFLFTKELSMKNIPPPLPFTTSTMLQSFHYSSKEIMKGCCSLYEKGYITYPRTSSTFYSKTFLETAKKYITDKHGDKYVSSNLSRLEQIPSEPHEAIRVTDLRITNIRADVPPKEAQIYDRIWKNTVQSCMADAVVKTIDCFLTRGISLKCSEDLTVFNGWKPLTETQFHFLNNIPSDSLLQCKKMTAQFLPSSNNHYTEGSLIQKLEELGIGKPSTFANLVNVIQERNYVTKRDIEGEVIEKKYYEMNESLTTKMTKCVVGSEKNKLQITHTGIVVIKFLLNYFPKLFDYAYTSEMEENLESVNYKEYSLEIDNCISSIDSGKEEIVIDDNNKLIIGRNGSVIVNQTEDGSRFIKVNQDIDLSKISEYKLSDIIDSTGYRGSYMNEDIYIKNGRYGIYTNWKGKNISLPFKQVEKISLENVIWSIKQNAQKFNFELL